MEKIGTLSFEVDIDVDRFGESIDWIWTHKRIWMARVGLRNRWIGRADFRNFLMAMKRRSPNSLAIFSLRLDGQPIAAALAMLDHYGIDPCVSTFDERWAKRSPGRVLLESLLQWACEHDLTYELDAGEELYKKTYISREGRLLTYTLPLSWRGRAFVALKPWRDRLIVEAGRKFPRHAREAIKRIVWR